MVLEFPSADDEDSDNTLLLFNSESVKTARQSVAVSFSSKNKDKDFGCLTGCPFGNHRGWQCAIFSLIVTCLFGILFFSNHNKSPSGNIDRIFPMVSPPFRWSDDQPIGKLVLPGYPIFSKRQPIFEPSSQNGNTKTILFWTQLFGRDSWALDSFGREPFINLSCPISNCFVTNNRSQLNEADAILIHFRDDFNYSDRPITPGQRKPNQLWTYVLWESPDHTYDPHWQQNRDHHELKNFSNFFNLTMTYRLDSDISFHYGRYVPLSEPDFSRIGFDRLANKTKSAVWMNSHCDTPSHREFLAYALLDYMDVDTIGECGSNVPDLTDGLCNRPAHMVGTSDECLEHLSSTYKFYLSFENSLCRDYVTEKFYRAAKLDLIPVVFNGANMSLFAPPHSYIDAQKFSSPADLAKFLLKVGSDSMLYNSYFWWKPFYNVENLWDKKAFTKHFCDLCAKVNYYAPFFERKSYEDIDDWWTTGGHCKEGTSDLLSTANYDSYL